MTQVEASDIVVMLTAAYPSWKPTDDSLKLYVEMLRPFDADLGKQVVMELLYSPREFAPPVGVIAEAIAVAKLKRAGQYLSPEEAWGEVADRIRRVGSYRRPEFSHPALARAVEAMGWLEICRNDNVEATRAHLMRIFDALQRRQVRDELTLLVGAEPIALPAEPKQIESRREQLPPPEQRERFRDLLKETLANFDQRFPGKEKCLRV